MGLPCAHVLAPLVETNQLLTLDMIHKQRHLSEIVIEPIKRPNAELEIQGMLENLASKVKESVPHIREDFLNKINDMINSVVLDIENPAQVTKRRQPKSAKKTRYLNSTKRHQSLFKIVDPPAIKKKCSWCRQKGNNARTCPGLG